MQSITTDGWDIKNHLFEVGDTVGVGTESNNQGRVFFGKITEIDSYGFEIKFDDEVTGYYRHNECFPIQKLK